LDPEVPQTFSTPPPPQVWGGVQLPQLTLPPQPLSIVPQVLPAAAHVVGMHSLQTFWIPPPPQVWGGVQLPQPTFPPQPLSIVPQVLPAAAHVVGMQSAMVTAAAKSRAAAIPVAIRVIGLLA
jgi:hypothetical protein